MSRAIKHVGFGKWVVLEAGEKIAGPFDKAQAQAFATEQSSKPTTEVVSEKERERAYLARMNADLRADRDRKCGKVRAALSEDFDADTVSTMMRQIEPIIVAGKEAGRRERFRYIAPVKAAAKAA